MLLTPAGTVKVPVNPEQASKALAPILVTPAGIVIEEIPVQPRNAKLPISVSVLGKVTFRMLALLANAYAGSTVIPSGTVMLRRFVQPAKMNPKVEPVTVVHPVESVILLSPVQFLKA